MAAYVRWRPLRTRLHFKHPRATCGPWALSFLPLLVALGFYEESAALYMYKLHYIEPQFCRDNLDVAAGAHKLHRKTKKELKINPALIHEQLHQINRAIPISDFQIFLNCSWYCGHKVAIFHCHTDIQRKYIWFLPIKTRYWDVLLILYSNCRFFKILFLYIMIGTAILPQLLLTAFSDLLYSSHIAHRNL